MQKEKFEKRMDQFMKAAIESVVKSEGDITDNDIKEIYLIRELICYAKELNSDVEELKIKIAELEKKKESKEKK